MNNLTKRQLIKKLFEIAKNEGERMEDVAERMDYSRQYLSMVKNYKMEPSFKFLTKMANDLGYDISRKYDIYKK